MATSTQAAIDSNKNSFTTGGTLTTSDIQNKADFKASSYSVTVGVSGAGQQTAPMTSGGIGSKDGNASSTTTAGISGVAGDTGKRTGDSAQGIGKIFDADKVRADIQAQVTITAEFGKQAGKAVSDYSTTQRKELQEQIKTASDADKATLQKQLDDVNTQERVLNVLVGAVSGMGASAVTKETLAAAADEMRALMVKDSSTFAGVVDPALFGYNKHTIRFFRNAYGHLVVQRSDNAGGAFLIMPVVIVSRNIKIYPLRLERGY